jgi:hypothetical protein
MTGTFAIAVPSVSELLAQLASMFRRGKRRHKR